MSAWILDYTDHAKKDLAKLDGSQRGQVLKAIEKVSKIPYPTAREDWVSL